MFDMGHSIGPHRLEWLRKLLRLVNLGTRLWRQYGRTQQVRALVRVKNKFCSTINQRMKRRTTGKSSLRQCAHFFLTWNPQLIRPLMVPSPTEAQIQPPFSEVSLLTYRSVLLILVLLALVVPTSAANEQRSTRAAQQPLTILSQNCSGLGDATKIKYLEDLLLGINPLGVVLTETRTMPGAKLPLALSKYKLFEGKAVRDPKKHAKSMIWGVSIAIKSEYSPELVKLRGSVLQGRCVAVDTIIPVVDKSSTSVRIFAIYAPQICNSHVSTFWAAVDALLLDPKCPANWAITGDFNLTTCPAEATSRSWKISTSLTEYRELLNRHEAQDVWEATPDRSVHRDWTWRSFCDRRVRSMIDRAATNAPQRKRRNKNSSSTQPIGLSCVVDKSRAPRADHRPTQIGRASCRERVS